MVCQKLGVASSGKLFDADMTMTTGTDMLDILTADLLKKSPVKISSISVPVVVVMSASKSFPDEATPSFWQTTAFVEGCRNQL